MSWITEHLTETDERIPAAALRTEWYYDSMEDFGDWQDRMDDETWSETQEMFDVEDDYEDDDYEQNLIDHRDPIESSTYRGPL